MAQVGMVAAAMTSWDFDDGALVRLLAAAVLGAAVGVEREAGDQPAGLRTHIAVALGAALFGVISTLGFLEYDRPRSETVIQADVTRVASNVVVGIGFLGAGVIFRRGNSVRNLTTAASLWAVAAIGLACGVGDPTTAAIGTAILLVSLVVLRPLRDWIRRHMARANFPVRIRLVPGAEPHGVLAAARLAESEGERPVEMVIEEMLIEKEDGRLVVSLVLNAHPDRVREWVSRVSTSPDVEAVQQA